MIDYFVIAYKLFEKDINGNKIPFSPSTKLYIANVVAKTREEAMENLIKDFHMLTVEIVQVSDKMSMTREEYESED